MAIRIADADAIRMASGSRAARARGSLSPLLSQRLLLRGCSHRGCSRRGSSYREAALTEAALTEAALTEGAVTEAAVSDAVLTEAALAEAALTEAPSRQPLAVFDPKRWILKMLRGLNRLPSKKTCTKAKRIAPILVKAL